jgi:hypothetical protein
MRLTSDVSLRASFGQQRGSTTGSIRFHLRDRSWLAGAFNLRHNDG